MSAAPTPAVEITRLVGHVWPRCGVSHPPEPTRYAAGVWSPAELDILMNDRALRVRVLVLDTNPVADAAPEAPEETGRPEARPRTGRRRGAP